MKKYIIILTFIFAFLLISCHNNVEQSGTKPTKPYTINNYLGDNAVYQSNASLCLNGTAENGVIIKVEIINQNDKVIDSYKTITDEKKLTWSVELTTPKASNDYYKVRVSDTYNEYVYEYNNIRFGQLWFVAGDSFDKYSVSVETKELKNNKNVSFYQVSANSHWLTDSEKELIDNNFVFKFADELNIKDNMPIGIVIGIEEKASIEEWLPLDTIKSVENILNYVKKNNKYDETNLKEGYAGYLFESKYKELIGLSFTGITWYYGVDNLERFNDTEYTTTYFQILTNLFENWHNLFNCKKIGVYQTPSINEENCLKLRHIQNVAVNYYTYVQIIPIVDLCNIDETGNFSLDLDAIIERTYAVLKQKKKVSSYANLVFDINDNSIVDRIKIEFNNTDRLMLTEDDETINYLVVKYKEDGINEQIIDLKPLIEENYLIFNLSYEVKTTDDEGNEVTTIEYYEKSLITIEFAQENDISDINIFNENMIPLLPFKIIME